jgi:hypothetical protein
MLLNDVVLLTVPVMAIACAPSRPNCAAGLDEACFRSRRCAGGRARWHRCRTSLPCETVAGVSTPAEIIDGGDQQIGQPTRC